MRVHPAFDTKTRTWFVEGQPHLEAASLRELSILLSPAGAIEGYFPTGFHMRPGAMSIFPPSKEDGIPALSPRPAPSAPPLSASQAKPPVAEIAPAAIRAPTPPPHPQAPTEPSKGDPFDLSPAERRMFDLLVARPQVTPEAAAVHGVRSLKVVISRIRKKTRADVLWNGDAWSMTPDAKKRIARMGNPA